MNILRHLKETPLEQGRETSNKPVPQMEKRAGGVERAGEVKVSHILKQVLLHNRYNSLLQTVA